MRTLVKVVRLGKIIKHPKADRLDITYVGGWQVVIQKGQFNQGDLAVFFEIDSWIPTTLFDLNKPGQEPKKFNGVLGNRLRSVRLKGELSQGLLLPMSILESSAYDYDADDQKVFFAPEQVFQEGVDVSDLLGVLKYEDELPDELIGKAKGMFPLIFPKTDMPRFQNMEQSLLQYAEEGLFFSVQEKLEGESMTCYLTREDEFGVCTKNVDLLDDAENLFWQVARRMQIEDKMRFAFDAGQDVAIQGELIGPGIRGNPYNLKEPTFVMFNVVYGHDGQVREKPEVAKFLAEYMNIPFVPVIFKEFKATPQTMSMAYLTDLANGMSLLNNKQRREGLVFKCNKDPRICFKAISSEYLLKAK